MGCWVLLGDMTPQANDFPLGEGEKGVAVTLHAGATCARRCGGDPGSIHCTYSWPRPGLLASGLSLAVRHVVLPVRKRRDRQPFVQRPPVHRGRSSAGTGLPASGSLALSIPAAGAEVHLAAEGAWPCGPDGNRERCGG